MINRGLPASAFHNHHRHLYISVDSAASNWRDYLYGKINTLRQTGIIHVIDSYTHKEIERLYV